MINCIPQFVLYDTCHANARAASPFPSPTPRLRLPAPSRAAEGPRSFAHARKLCPTSIRPQKPEMVIGIKGSRRQELQAQYAGIS